MLSDGYAALSMVQLDYMPRGAVHTCRGREKGFPSCVTSPVSIVRFDCRAAKQDGTGIQESEGAGGRYREDIWGGIAR